MSIIQGTSKAAAGGGHTIAQSIRFNDNDSAHLTRTPASAGNRRTWTLSWWVKRANLGSRMQMFSITASGGTQGIIEFDVGDGPSTDQLILNSETSGTTALGWELEWKFRDPSAWYHFVMVYDTTQATTNDRVKVYINGEQAVDGWDRNSTPAQNAEQAFNSTNAMNIGKPHYTPTGAYFDGYMAEIHFIDGTALDASSFGEVNSDTGQWVPIAYSGSYGTNGFYITGEDSADLGADYSGNGNDFTSNLTSADQRTDTPTNNHCTFNPLWIDTYTLSDGNLVTSTGGDASALGTMAVDATDSDGWYWEMKVTTAATYPGVGIILASQTSLVANTALSGTNTNRYYYEGWSGDFNNQGSTGAYGGTWSGTANKVIGVYLKGGALWFSIDGVVQNSGDPSTASTGAAITGLTGDFYPVVVYPAGSGTQAAWTAQFAEADWGTTPPAGYKALSTANLPDPTIADPSAHMQTTTYTGNGTAIGSGGNAVDQSGNSTFQPDFVWIKNRSAADNHMLYDAVRGATKDLHSNTADAEATDTEGLSTFDADGFTVGSNVAVNTSTENYVAWQWKANGSGSSNTDGSITSTVSANQTAGFSILTYTGTGSAATIGHGLGVTPDFVVVKKRVVGTDDAWIIWHEGLPGPNYYLNFDTGAQDTSVNYWNNTLPTSSVFSVGASNGTNQSGKNFVAYLWNEVEGFSKFGKYTGNGSTDGPFIYTGFRPAFILYKNIATAGTHWDMLDSTREPYNTVGKQLMAESSAVEAAEDHRWDFLSNGFKARDGSSSNNQSGASIIFMAFAESPFKYATAR